MMMILMVIMIKSVSLTDWLVVTTRVTLLSRVPGTRYDYRYRYESTFDEIVIKTIVSRF
jgi:hypothetical protein